MPRQGRHSLLSDQPARKDQLDFAAYRRTLRGIIASPDTDTPLTIGVFGKWGTGKTTLLQMVMDDLQARHVVVWFTAWKYDREEVLWRALLLRVIAAVREDLASRHTDDKKAQQKLDEAAEKLDELEETLYQASERVEAGGLQVNLRDFLAGAAETGVKVALATVPGLNLATAVVEELGKSAGTKGPERIVGAFKRAQKQVRVAQVKSLEQFEGRFKALVETYIAPRRLVVFVDDLDRCLPQKAVEVLEAIKLFLDVPGCVFVLGMDRDVISAGIRVKYHDLQGQIDGERYLEKVIQLPFDLPVLEVDDVRRYVRSLAPRLPDPRCEDVFAAGLSQPNPRRIKRMINSFLFLSRLAKERAARLGAQLNDVRLAKIVAIQHGEPELYALFRFYPGYLAEFEAHYRSVDGADQGPKPHEAYAYVEVDERTAREIMAKQRPKPDQACARPPLSDALKEFASRRALRELIVLFPDDPEACFSGLTVAEIRPYFSLVRSVSAPQATVATPTLVPELVAVPAGEFLMGTSEEDVRWLVEHTGWAKEWQSKGSFTDEQPQHSVLLPAYEIGRYPVTNLEYQAFVQATQRTPPAHWGGDTAPDEIGNHPVVNVGYEDARAYCAWLAERTGRPFALPTEAQWEKAARETDGRHYPWGNDFDARRCNTSEGGVGGTTAVGQYSPAGDSPYGCADMAGNVWQWCMDWYAEGYYRGAPHDNPPGPAQGSTCVVRGGSWDNNQKNARCACRDGYNRASRSDHLGFRVAVAPPVSR